MTRKPKRNLPEKKARTRLVCTNCDTVTEHEDFKAGEILFCEKCQGSLHPEEKARSREKEFGKYKILGEIGRGGMGVVFRARHLSLKKDVALKVLAQRGGVNRGTIERLHSEAQSASKLRHPNIVAVHDVDVFEDEHYIAMDYIDGVGMDTLVRKKPLKPRKAAKLLLDVSRAIHHAHDKGIIHRDIKPSNILVDREGKPYVMDFGIARDVSGEREGTPAGTVMGTPGYMSPEQARGDKNIDRRSDVFSLGALLFFLLTGEPPFQGADTTETIALTKSRDPVEAEVLGRDVPGDLAAICLKTLSKSRRDRYKSAGLLSEDIERFLRGDPVLSASYGLADTLSRSLRRHRIPLAIGAIVLAGFAVLLAVALSPSSSRDTAKIKSEADKKMKKVMKEQAEKERLRDEARQREKDERNFQFAKTRITDKIDGLKNGARIKLDNLERTYFQNPEATFRELDEIESELKSFGKILEEVARGEPALRDRLEADRDIAGNMNAEPFFPRIQSVRARTYSVLAWVEWTEKLDAEKALSFYNLAIGLSPRPEVSFFYGRGMVHFESGNFEAANPDLTHAIGHDPKLASNPQVIRYVVETKARVGKFEEAESILERLEDGSADKVFLKGVIAHSRRDYVTAEKRFQQTSRLDRRNVQAPMWLGKTLLDAGEYGRAKEAMGMVTQFSRWFQPRRDPNKNKRDNLIMLKPTAMIHLYLGIARIKAAEKGGNSDEIAEAKKKATENFKKALELVPGLKEAEEWLRKIS